MIPWLDQALGRPTERHEHRLPTRLEDLKSMDTRQLEQLVARGRRRRLERVAEEGDGGNDDVVIG